MPACAGRVCGDDGCGGSCGPCAANQVCGIRGVCIACGTNDTPCCDAHTCPSGLVCSGFQACCPPQVTCLDHGQACTNNNQCCSGACATNVCTCVAASMDIPMGHPGACCSNQSGGSDGLCREYCI